MKLMKHSVNKDSLLRTSIALQQWPDLSDMNSSWVEHLEKHPIWRCKSLPSSASTSDMQGITMILKMHSSAKHTVLPSPPQLNIQSLWQYQQLPNVTFHIPPLFGWYVLERELETLTLNVRRFRRRLKELNWELRLQNGSFIPLWGWNSMNKTTKPQMLFTLGNRVCQTSQSRWSQVRTQLA